jgi:peptidyl-prolyl cis-trans isomerase SurA
MPVLDARCSTLPAALLACALTALSASTACRSTPAEPAAVPADAWAVVDDRTISAGDVDKAWRRMRDPSQTPSGEEALAEKLALLDELIVQDILLARAASLKVELPQGELDAAYDARKKNLTDAAFQEELARRKLTADDMREGLRRELLTEKLLEQEVASAIAITDQEVNEFFAANRAQFNVAEDSYRLAQIVVTPVRESRVANGTGDDAATPQAAAAKIQMLMQRLQAGASFRDLAAGYSEDPDSAPRGGDLGLVPVSRLKQAPPALRNAVLNKEPGTVNVVSADGAHTLVLVVAREAAGQRDLSTPGLRDRIVETLRGRKQQLVRLAYLTAARGEARVVNHIARRVVEAKGVPGAAPGQPGRQ